MNKRGRVKIVRKKTFVRKYDLGLKAYTFILYAQKRKIQSIRCV